MQKVLVIFSLLLLSVVASMQSSSYTTLSNQEVVNAIRDLVKNPDSSFNHQSYNRLAYIVDTYGPRMWGSESQALAIDDLFEQMKGMNLDRIDKENLGNITTWRRGKESLTLYEPRPVPQKLNLIGLGLGAPGDVTAEVIVVRSFHELAALGSDKVAGKIVCFNQEWVDYDESVEYRAAGPAAAAHLGAVGALVRSVASFSINSPHTGGTYYDGRRIPAAAIAIEDAEMFQRMQDRGQTIRVHLYIESEWYHSTSDNLIAEIRGSQYPDQILLLGGHFDSWDTGAQTGANDDGGGVMVCLEVLNVLNALGLRPKRTIRFVAWSGEEMSLAKAGAFQYASRHANETHILAFESDEGTTQPYGFGFSGGPRGTQMVINLATQFLSGIGAEKVVPGDGVMVDTEPLFEKGIPVMRNLIQDNESHDFYFTYHHSAGDSMYMMNAEDMDDNVVAIASMFYLIADASETLPMD